MTLSTLQKAQRAIAACRDIAAMSEEAECITRRFLTPPMHAVHAYLQSRMEALGMTVRADAMGNLRALSRPTNAGMKRILLGSHIDTVPNAGAFDGVLGVTVALELVAMAQEAGLPLALEVIAFSEEEGVRYGVPYFGSRAVAGRFDRALLEMTDAEGISVEAALRAFGLDPVLIQEAAMDEDAACFLEVHIEQGPVLEAENLRVAAVTSIAGQTRLSLTFTGHANHAGTTPMHLRHDALAAAAEWISAVENLALRTEGLVATVGRLSVEPNAGNVVPGVVRVSLDARHAYNATRAAAVEELVAHADAIANRRGISVERKNHLDQPAVPMDERITALLTAAMEAAALAPKTMASGAGHDALVMATRLPTGMLFVRSPDGISHHPDEAVHEEDVEAALNVGLAFLRQMASHLG